MQKTILFLAILGITKVVQAQNVGIGTTSPGYPLTVVKDGIGISQESTDGSAKIGFYTVPGFAYIQTHTNTDLSFATFNGAPKMTLATSGNLGIGNTNPGFTLDVNGRARLRYNAATAGIWYNKQNNVSPASFVGQINDTTYGMITLLLPGNLLLIILIIISGLALSLLNFL
jgi:hypothetical protein